MIRAAKDALKYARSDAEKKLWRKRLQSLEANKELKFSNRVVRRVT